MNFDELIEINNSSGLIIDLQYPKLDFKYAINRCLVRKEVLDKLLLAKLYLPSNLTFKILDAYRPFELQNELYDYYRKIIIKNFRLDQKPAEEQEQIINRYVSKPLKDKLYAPPHTTGGAVDIILADKKTGKSLNMGCKFDEFSDLARTNAYEKERMDKQIRTNRRILYNAMIKAGFTNLPTEFWHYDYGNKNWAYYKNKEIKYKGVW